MKFINVLAVVLVILGGINWGLMGVAEFNVVDYLFKWAYIDRIVYTAIGVSAIYLALAWKVICRSFSR